MKTLITVDPTEATNAPTTPLPQSGTDVTQPVDVATVPTKPCCDILLGDECDCRAYAAQARGVFARNAITCRPASQWGAA